MNDPILTEPVKASNTPGEWYAARAEMSARDEQDVDPNRWSVLVKDGDRLGFIATIENGLLGDTLETEAANAHLLASSKDLLAACQWALKCLAACYPAGAEKESELLNTLQAAIAKAVPNG